VIKTVLRKAPTSDKAAPHSCSPRRSAPPRNQHPQPRSLQPSRTRRQGLSRGHPQPWAPSSLLSPSPALISGLRALSMN